MEIVDAFRQSSPTWDVILIAFLFVGGFFYGMSMGRMRLIVSLMSLYIAKVLFPLLPFTATLTRSLAPMQGFILRTALFLVMLGVIYILLMHSAFSSARGGREGEWHQTLAISLTQVGLLVTVILSLVPSQSKNALAPVVDILFLQKSAEFWWTIMPLIALALVRSRRD
ncbi:MAG: hypothetical protein HY460_02475 [Parcubacteria group bacterium]|nr:hypothetical protein [Parcubacteria group bacterium]